MTNLFNHRILRLLVAITTAIFVSSSVNSVTEQRGLQLSMKRLDAGGTLIFLQIRNPTSRTWCLNPISFSASQFEIKLKDRVVDSKGPRPSLAAACIKLRAGEARSAQISLRQAFSLIDLRVGVLCYMFSFHPDPLPRIISYPPNGLRTIAPAQPNSLAPGAICEGENGIEYAAPL